MNEKFCILIPIWLKFVPKGQICLPAWWVLLVASLMSPAASLVTTDGCSNVSMCLLISALCFSFLVLFDCCILLEIKLTTNNTALVQVMAWHRISDKPLPEPILTQLMHTCSTRGRGVKKGDIVCIISAKINNSNILTKFTAISGVEIISSPTLTYATYENLSANIFWENPSNLT